MQPDEPVASSVQVKAALLLVLFIALVAGTALYLLYARGAFERTQRLVLVADDAEGVRVGMDLTFSGFPIGRVRRIELAPDGDARILVDVPRDDAKWLRQSSVFTLVRNIVGGATLRAYSGVLTDPPLPDGAERPVLIGDTNAELPRLVGAARELVQNLSALTASDAALATSLANVQQLTERLNGPGGAMGVLTGDAAQAKQLGAALATTLARTNALLARIDGMAARVRRWCSSTPCWPMRAAR
jgi:phospholipid/cholesterol/gamma-HCH transport system substrate-binding protein